MIKTLNSYLKSRGWKDNENQPSQNTSLGKFSYEVWNNLYSPKVSDVEAIKFLIEKRNEIKI